MCTKFLALNAAFSSPSPDLLDSKGTAQRVPKRGTALKSGYLSAVGLSSVKMVADRHRHVAEQSKHW